MNFISTRGGVAPAGLREALFAGPAADGGLYVPETLTPLPARTLEEFPQLRFPEISRRVAEHLIGDQVPARVLAECVESSLDFAVPLSPVEERIWSLELFHGPTLAFKDVGARFMARLMSHFREPGDARRTILVATSGDTGSAIADAFHGLDGFEVVILFPSGMVSPRQQRQFTTFGNNVRAIAIAGVFDDCQALVRQAFADPVLRQKLRLASANSINVGRLLPQIFFYFHAVAQLPQKTDQVVISVPSGNFGNLTAGLMAKRLGLRCARLVAATNRNDVVPEYLSTGEFRPRKSSPTLSNAMDVGNPSNWERIVHLYDNDRSALRRDLLGFAFSDRQTRHAISDVHSGSTVLLDPHSAVGYLGLKAGLQHHPGSGGIFLSTAHPAKFSEIVEQETGTAPPVPDRLRQCLDRPEFLVSLPADFRTLRDHLLSGE